MKFAVVLLALVQPMASFGIGRRACLLGAGACLVPKAASASYALGVAAVQQQSWQPTGKEKEKAVYDRIDAALDEKRRFRDDAGALGYVGGEYTNYRRGEGRDKWEADRAEKKGSSGYASLEELDMLIVSKGARRMATP